MDTTALEQLHPPRRGKELGARTTRDDWLNAARVLLIDGGVERIKILPLAKSLGVARSSFYWFFKDREDLLNQLLDQWQALNTANLVDHAEMPSDTITQAVLNIFECWTGERIFDPGMDFAIRDWARKSDRVRQLVNAADEDRITAFTAMYQRHGFEARDAFIRARILYFMQIGYYALDVQESMEDRMDYVPDYIRGFTGQDPTEKELKRFRRIVKNARNY